MVSTVYRGVLAWDYVECGDGCWTAVSSADPTRVFARCNSGNLDEFGTRIVPVYTSARGGIYDSWTPANTNIDPKDNVNFIPPLVMDPSRDSTLYFGTCRVWQTMTSGSEWSPVSCNLARNNSCNPAEDNTGTISTIAVAPSDRRVVYAATNNARVWMTPNVNGGVGTWRRIDLPLPNRTATQITVDPTAPNTALVTFSGFSFPGAVGHVFRTTNGGTNWADITREDSVSGLPNVPVNDIAIDPAHRNTFFAATDVGVFYTTDAGTRWQPLVNGLPKVAVMSLKLHNASRTLRAATHGRNAWDINIGNDMPTGIMLLPDRVDFGVANVGQRNSHAITLNNAGDDTVNLHAIRLLGSNADQNTFQFDTDCGQTLKPGAGCKINVTFAPTATGSANAELVVSDDGLGSPRAVDLRGKGMLP
jgi:hypothetical protein